MMHFSHIDPLLVQIAAWILTYLVHSTVFYLIIKLVLMLKDFNASQIKEYLWRTALFGGIITASFQTLSGFSVISLPIGENPKSNTTIVPNYANNATSDQAFYEAMPKNEIVVINGEKESDLHPVIQKTPSEMITGSSVISLNDIITPLVFIIISTSIIILIFKILAYFQFISKIEPLEKVNDQKFQFVVRELCTEIKYDKEIKLKSSKNLKSPVALGNSNIFLPEISLKILTPDQTRSMLAHELAHLVRRDTWWNGLYSLIEAILFFQPLNKIIRKELQENGELLCDEWAVNVTGNKKALATCLIEVAAWYTSNNYSSVVPGMALHYKSLNNRINNILNYQAMKNNSKITITYILMITISLLVLIATPGFSIGLQQEAPETDQSKTQKQNPSYKKAAPSEETNKNGNLDLDTTKEIDLNLNMNENIDLDLDINEDVDIDQDINNDIEIDLDINPNQDFNESFEGLNNQFFNNDFSFQFNNDDMVWFQDSISKYFNHNYDTLFNDGFSFSFQGGDTTKLKSQSTSLTIKNDRKVIIENGEIKELWIDGQRIPDDEIKNHNIVIEDFNPHFRYQEEAKARQREAEIRRKDAESRANESVERRNEMAHRKEENVFRRKETELLRKDAENRRKEADVLRKEAEKRRMEADERRKEAEKFNSLLEEALLKDKLIQDPQNYSLQLSNEELKINDIRQPENIFKKYLKLYESKTGNSLKPNSSFTIKKNQDF